MMKKGAWRAIRQGLKVLMTVRAGKKEGAGRNITSPHNKRKNDVSNNEHRPLKGDVLIPSGGKHREKKGLIYLVSGLHR